jgi:hypothetical protein
LEGGFGAGFENNARFLKKMLALFYAGTYSRLIMTTISVITGGFVGVICSGVSSRDTTAAGQPFSLVKAD